MEPIYYWQVQKITSILHVMKIVENLKTMFLALNTQVTVWYTVIVNMFKYHRYVYKLTNSKYVLSIIR